MSRYIVSMTPGGMHTLAYRNGREVRIHSAYDPAREAERAVAAFNTGRATMIAVSGIGLGYHLAALKAAFPGIPILAVEHDEEVVALARESCPRNLEGVIVVVPGADLSAVFEELDVAGFRGIARYEHRPSYLLYPEYYDAVMREMGQYASSKMSDLLTRFEFEERWVENILRNIPRLFTAARVASLFGRFSGCPGIIVSAGPSLRKNVRVLERMRDRALIVAVDTAAPVLARTGVSPHLIMTLDAQKHSIRHFLGLDGGGAALIADMVSYPPVVRSFGGPAIMSATTKYYTAADGAMKRETTPLMGWIEKYIEPIGDLQSGGSVATSAFDLLLNLGCNPIILAGQDLAYTGREIDGSGTHHYSEWLPRTNRLGGLDSMNQSIIRRRKIKYVPAYGGTGKVISDFVFDLYRGWFEDSAAKVSVPVINATEGGARIRNTEEAALSALVDRLPSLSPVPADILARALAGDRRERPDRLAAAMKAAIRDLEEVSTAADRAMADREQAPAVEELVNREDTALILQPFLRKARTFLTRYKAGQEEAERLMLTDIRSAAARLIPALAACLEKLGA
ncbi:MAG TPA: DUF115 domain-containing protein [Spirochaetota bacterium]|nr:DUF115 domain-containing protein [Spirochaetota bacterium]